MTDLLKIYDSIKQNSDHTEFVWGAGNIGAPIMLIGEAPGKEEIKSGRPFSGAAGANLDEFLKTLGLERGQIFITNVCKFRPTKTSAKGTVSNRTPTRAEIKEAQPFLYEEINIVNPEIIAALGNTALFALFSDNKIKIGDVHGKILTADIKGKMYKVFPLYHPASVIYNQKLKQTYLEDLLKLKQIIKSSAFISQRKIFNQSV